MKNVFVAIVEKSFRTDRFEMSERATVNRDRFDPMNRVLQNKEIAQLKNNFMRQHWVRWGRADVEEKRAARFENPANLRGPGCAPVQIRLSILPVEIFLVADAEIVRR